MLKLNKIESKKKTVKTAKSYRVTVKLDAQQKSHVEEIIRCIEEGEDLPSWAYRVNVDDNRDILLNEMGIMHLHIGSKASKELLYVVQYSDHVVILELSNHKQLEDAPRGTILARFHKRVLAELEKAEAEELKLLAEIVAEDTAAKAANIKLSLH